MHKTSLIPIIIMLLYGCGSGTDSRRIISDPVSPVTIQKSDTPYTVNFFGIYKGVLPCADCRGIETRLELKSSGEYFLETTYITNRNVLSELDGRYEGNYSWNNDKKIVTLNGLFNQSAQYLYEDGSLFQLDINGNRITGPLAGQYILKQ